MKKTLSFFLVFFLSLLFYGLSRELKADSYMSDKTEIPVNLEVSGAEAICQTDDGYVWIAQYSGLIRYDSEEYINYKSFVQDGIEYSVINVKSLAKKQNVLYVGTNKNIFKYENNEFSVIDYDWGIISDITLDEVNDILYVSTVDNGGIIYNLNTKQANHIKNTEKTRVNDITINKKTGDFYYQTEKDVFDKDGNLILGDIIFLDIYLYGDILYLGDDNGKLYRYNIVTKSFLPEIDVADQINKLLYYEEDNILFAACEKYGLHIIDLSKETPSVSLAGSLENNSQLVDLMIDYEGNLWLASHYIGATGLSFITKNALVDLLYDDPIWQALNPPPAIDRNIYSVERFGNILYFLSKSNIYRYDLEQKKILPDNVLMNTLNEYASEKGIALSPKDVEVHKNKVYFAVSGVGLVEYDPVIEKVNIYDAEYMAEHMVKNIGDANLLDAKNVRCLRSFDNYLACGYARGLLKFDDEGFSVIYQQTNVLYINKTNDGKLLFNRSNGIYEVDDDFSSVKTIYTTEDKSVTGNVLKFLVDGNYIYYNLNSRLFKLEQINNEYVSDEITIPFVKGSIVELSKVEYKKANGDVSDKYVIGSQNQIYITDNLNTDTLTNYDLYDNTNGLQPIIANSSGFYDQENHLYYFQSTNGILVYNFNELRDITVPSKMTVSSIDLDGVSYYGNDIKISKDNYRLTFNLSIFGFKPNKGYTIYYKLDGVDDDYIIESDSNRSIYYSNLSGGNYKFHVYVVDEYGQKSNQVTINLVKDKKIYEQVWFWIIIILLILAVIISSTFLIIKLKMRQSLKKQLEYKNITVEAIQAIARTIDAKDEYTNGHSIRVGYYSKLIAQNLGMSEDEVDNIYYIALLHDIGKIAIPDSILNKPGRLSDDEFKVMKSHTTRGAKILKGISTIPHIIEGAKSHHEKWDGTGYPEGLKGEEIPYVARIICCADCFDAMASKRVYKEPFPIERIEGEFERCAGTQFDPSISIVVVKMMKEGILKPYAAENTYLGEDGKTHRITTNVLENE